jgi:hypothetical protein
MILTDDKKKTRNKTNFLLQQKNMLPMAAHFFLLQK